MNICLRLLDYLFPRDPSTFMSAEGQTTHERRKAASTMGHYLQWSEAGQLDVLDFGCGWGGETLWLAERVRSVVGVDVNALAIDRANAARVSSGLTNCRFAWSKDGTLPFPNQSFDVVVSTDTFEHVMDLDQAFTEIYRVLRPKGVLRTRFGPLFYSPFGYHLRWACQVPYAHLLFGLDAIADLRAKRGGSQHRPTTWQDLGLNGKRFTDYQAAVSRAGFEIVNFHPIPVKGLTMLASLPLIGDWFIFGIDCSIQRPYTLDKRQG